MKTIEIPSHDPFANDLFNRKFEAENLYSIFKNSESPMVFALDAKWGAGKTTFIKMFEKFLLNHGEETIYINSWLSDFSDDPLISILSEIDLWISARSTQNDTVQWETVRNVTSGIVKSGVVAGVKLLTLNALDLDKEYEKVISDLSSESIGQLMDCHNKSAESSTALRKAIESAIKSVVPDGKNIIIFIDELDRCRPTYSIELLERVKHVFDINNVIFVLSVDITQLANSIKAVYGQEFDSRAYLRRFFNLDYSLDVTISDEFVESMLDCNALNSFFSNRAEAKIEKYELRKNLVFISEHFGMSAREVNICVKKIIISLRLVKNKEVLHVPIFVFLTILKMIVPDLYSRFNANEDCFEELMSVIQPKISANNSTPLSILVSQIMYFHYSGVCYENGTIEKYKQIVSNKMGAIDGSDIEGYIADTVIKKYEEMKKLDTAALGEDFIKYAHPFELVNFGNKFLNI